MDTEKQQRSTRNGKILTMNTANTDGLTDEQRIDLLHSVGLTDDDIYNAGSLIK